MLKIALCEDNPIQTQRIKSAIENILHVPYELTCFCKGADFLQEIRNNACPFSLILMDIELETASLSGISLAKRLNSLSPKAQIIFITQYSEYASDVYETAHTWFLTKDNLEKYLPKALRAALKNLETSRGPFFSFQKKADIYRIPAGEILYMERVLRETFLHTSRETYRFSEKLSQAAKRLPVPFVLCHRSFLVNLKYVQSLNRQKLTLITGTTLPVARSCYPHVREALTQMVLTEQTENREGEKRL